MPATFWASAVLHAPPHCGPLAPPLGVNGKGRPPWTAIRLSCSRHGERDAERADARIVPAVTQRRFWGWGIEGEGPTPAQQQKMAGTVATRFGIEPPVAITPPTIDEIELRSPRVEPP